MSANLFPWLEPAPDPRYAAEPEGAEKTAPPAGKMPPGRPDRKGRRHKRRPDKSKRWTGAKIS